MSQQIIKKDDSYDDAQDSLEYLATDVKLNKLLKTVVNEVRLYAEDQIRHIRQYAKIGIALSIEHNIDKLLEMIVEQARLISNADAGTLYIFDEEKERLCFKIVQNASLNLRMGGTSGNPVEMNGIPLYTDDRKPNLAHVSSFVAQTGKIVNTPNVYNSEDVEFTGPRVYDASMGYRSESMLVIPMKNHEQSIIGVLQLINATDPETGKIVPFPPDHVDLVASLASQAAVALTNIQLIQNLKSLIKHIKHVAEIGQALSVENNIDKLLEDIVKEARELCNADAGTLYTLNSESRCLQFRILQNDSLNVRMGGTRGKMINLSEVPLFRDDKPNYANVSSYVAITGEIVNIPDVYKAEGFDFTGTREYDQKTKYRSKSMLVIPMKDHNQEIIGVLQLLNAQKSDKSKVIPFSTEYEDLIASLASQAGVALIKTQLIQDLKDLFYAFIQSIATAIEKKSRYTGGHITRVVELSMMIAEKINQTQDGYFKDIHFTADELEELKLAAWMHDVGKITTPEYVVDKATKLETIFDRVQLIETRYDLIAKTVENDYLHRKLRFIQEKTDCTDEFMQCDQEMAEELKALREEFEFVKRCNNTGDFMKDEQVERIQKIARKSFMHHGKPTPYLTDDEVQKLTIRKGTLTADEREQIENHVMMTYEILKQLPFPKHLSKVPEYASQHHEKLDGSGYPWKLKNTELPLQSRIMAVADIFEALTAKDRPYKKPMTLSQAIKVLGFMKNDHHIDPNIYDLFIESGLFMEYARKELNPEQNDM